MEAEKKPLEDVFGKVISEVSNGTYTNEEITQVQGYIDQLREQYKAIPRGKKGETQRQQLQARINKFYNSYEAGGGDGGLGGGGGGSQRTTPGSAGTGGGSALNTGQSGSISPNSAGGAGGENTGGGGGGGSHGDPGGAGGAGGKGVVIIRYKFQN